MCDTGISDIDLSWVPAEEVELVVAWAAQRRREQVSAQEDDDMDAEGEPAVEEGEKLDWNGFIFIFQKISNYPTVICSSVGHYWEGRCKCHTTTTAAARTDS